MRHTRTRSAAFGSEDENDVEGASLVGRRRVGGAAAGAAGGSGVEEPAVVYPPASIMDPVAMAAELARLKAAWPALSLKIAKEHEERLIREKERAEINRRCWEGRLGDLRIAAFETEVVGDVNEDVGVQTRRGQATLDGLRALRAANPEREAALLAGLKAYRMEDSRCSLVTGLGYVGDMDVKTRRWENMFRKHVPYWLQNFKLELLVPRLDVGAMPTYMLPQDRKKLCAELREFSRCVLLLLGDLYSTFFILGGCALMEGSV